MSEAKHTPGPWTTDPEYDHQNVLGADGIMVADCSIFVNPKFGDRTDIGNAANARLIAAAPDLLAALIDIMRWYDAPAAPLSNLIGKSDDAIAMFDRARAAIAKAEGQS